MSCNFCCPYVMTACMFNNDLDPTDAVVTSLIAIDSHVYDNRKTAQEVWPNILSVFIVMEEEEA